MAVRTAYDPTAGEVLTATNLEKLAGGWLGYNEATVNQGSITTVVDMTTLTVTVTVGPSRRIRIHGSAYPSGTTGEVCRLYIMEGATQLQERDVAFGATSVPAGLEAFVVLTPTTGAHTYKLQMARVSGTNGITNNAGATLPSFVLCEDIGPAA